MTRIPSYAALALFLEAITSRVYTPGARPAIEKPLFIFCSSNRESVEDLALALSKTID
jgi:hypothetical protein